MVGTLGSNQNRLALGAKEDQVLFGSSFMVNSLFLLFLLFFSYFLTCTASNVSGEPGALSTFVSLQPQKRPSMKTQKKLFLADQNHFL